ncbi:MAG: hypothetical protein RMK15_04395 [Chloroflexota bacterium]|nr:hypothetical protein [Dehalococcoidia bacterium]MDW8046500.1 hypothetical protein [Chloroflexota bacterium]
MVQAPDVSADIDVWYEGPGQGAEEIMGGTLANFLVVRPNLPDKEAAVILNDPAAEWLAERLGVEPTKEFRERAAEVLGELWIRHLYREHRRVDSLSFIGRAVLEAHPELVQAFERVWRQRAAA